MELITARAPFRDRADAGRLLARSLSRYATESGVVVLGLARGGVPVAREVADALGASIGVIVARQLTVPGVDEVALGAIAEGSQQVVADTVAWYLGVPPRVVERLAARERVELERSVARYQSGLARFELRGRTVILVDDGLATSAALRAAIRSVRHKRPARVVVAIPVASRSTVEDLKGDVDEMVAILRPTSIDGVTAPYADYSPVTDEDVLALIGRASRPVSPTFHDFSDRIASALAGPDTRSSERTIRIPASDTTMAADLGIPIHAMQGSDGRGAAGVRGLAVIVDSGATSPYSYRNRYIAGRLRLSGYATLRIGLLTPEERREANEATTTRFEVERMALRLTCACEWVDREGIAGAHRTILISASTGAAASLLTAARRQDRTFAVIARSGRVDLVADALPHVQASVLLIAGAEDHETLRHKTEAIQRLPHGAVLVRVPRAGRVFEEPGTLGLVAEHIVSWLARLERRSGRGDAWYA